MSPLRTAPVRFIGLDIHKHYLVAVVMDAINVVFLSVFRGTAPYARAPRGARASIGVRVMFLPHSSTSTKSVAGRTATWWWKSVRACSSRSVAPSVFFCVSSPRAGWPVPLSMGSPMSRAPRSTREYGFRWSHPGSPPTASITWHAGRV